MSTILYLSHDGTDNSVANTARVSFAGEDWMNLPENYTEKQRDGLIKYLAKHKHVSPFRHNSISLRCEEAIPIARQLGKHQAGLSWNEVSRRYVTEDVTFFHPDIWRKKPEKSIKQGSGEDFSASENIEIEKDFNEVLRVAINTYNKFLEKKMAPELARYVLPQAMNTKWIWTGNLLAFAHVYKERIAKNAQLECQLFAKELDSILRPLFPVSWAALVDV
jgi:thymidylate synthase (FAD)